MKSEPFKPSSVTFLKMLSYVKEGLPWKKS